MTKVKVCAFSVSLDGYGAGPEQSLDTPLGIRGGELHPWLVETKVFREMTGHTGGAGGTEGTDNEFAFKSFENIGAWIMGRNMFGPIRGEWPDDSWKGWWGDNPPYHVPVFVLTHYEREPLRMQGGTTFHFVTDGIQSALDRAREAAHGKDIRIGGGASVIRQYLQAGLIDEFHLAMSPVLLGAGEHLFENINLHELGYTVSDSIAGEKASHLIIHRNY